MKKEYVFTGTNNSLMDFEVIFHFAGFWTLGLTGIIGFFCNLDNIPLLIFAAFLLLYPSGYEYFYYRWLLFEYCKNITLSIDTDYNIFTYAKGDRKYIFSSSDIKEWWNYRAGPYLSTFINIIEIRLKTGERVIISCGLKDAVEFINDHYRDLDFPEEKNIGKSMKYKSFKEYIKEIK